MHYYIGLPEWRHPNWYAEGNQPDQPLKIYSRHFNSVEGNTSFYALPGESTVANWQQNTPENFRFCFKFPKTISHDAQLRHCFADVHAFLDRLSPLTEKLGLLWLQMGPGFGPQNLSELDAFLQRLPNDFRYGIEVRHEGFFKKDDAEIRFNQLLMDKAVNRVMFDTRSIFAHPGSDPASLEAQRKKPGHPLHVLATGEQPMLRFISPMDISLVDKELRQWAGKTHQWLTEGRTPYLFFHTPDKRHAPQLALRFSQLLAGIDPQIQAVTLWPAQPQQEGLW